MIRLLESVSGILSEPEFAFLLVPFNDMFELPHVLRAVFISLPTEISLLEIPRGDLPFHPLIGDSLPFLSFSKLSSKVL